MCWVGRHHAAGDSEVEGRHEGLPELLDEALGEHLPAAVDTGCDPVESGLDPVHVKGSEADGAVLGAEHVHDPGVAVVGVLTDAIGPAPVPALRPPVKHVGHGGVAVAYKRPLVLLPA